MATTTYKASPSNQTSQVAVQVLTGKGNLKGFVTIVAQRAPFFFECKPQIGNTRCY